MYIAKCNGCHYCVGCILQCAMVVITMLDVYCNVLCFSSLCWMYILQCNMMGIPKWDAYFKVLW